MLRLTALTVAAFCLVYLAESTALACSCGFGPALQYPEDGDSDVPTNARLWSNGPFPDEFVDEISIRDEADQSIIALEITTVTTEHDSPIQIYIPQAPLSPNTTHSVVHSTVPPGTTPPPGTDPQWEVVLTFTTGSGPDETAPSVPSVVDSTIDAGREGGDSNCHSGEFFLAQFDVDFEGVLLVVDRDETATAGDELTGR